MLEAARSGQFDLLIVEDVSRLWRNRAEFGPRSAELEDLRVNMVTAVGDDARRDGWGLTVQIKLAMAEHARREASYRTRRGLEGKARAGKDAGGRAYGYIPAAQSVSKQREVNAAEAKIVRRIFEMRAEGMSCIAIAPELNTDKVSAPGAHWKRSDGGGSRKTASGTWRSSAIAGDPSKGTGILNNPLYKGMVIWGRTVWDRSAQNRAIRKPRLNAEAE